MPIDIFGQFQGDRLRRYGEANHQMHGVEVDLVRLSVRHYYSFSGGGTLFHGGETRRSMSSRMSFKIAST